MKAQQLQQQLVFNAEKLTEMYAEYASLRAERKKWNDMADDVFSRPTVMVLHVTQPLSQKKAHYRAQAAIFTPYINKLRKRIAALEAVQKALKQELKSMQVLEAFVAEDDAFWLSQAEVVQGEGYAEPGWYSCCGTVDVQGSITWGDVRKLEG